jgi:hypothetical protein
MRSSDVKKCHRGTSKGISILTLGHHRPLVKIGRAAFRFESLLLKHSLGAGATSPASENFMLSLAGTPPRDSEQDLSARIQRSGRFARLRPTRGSEAKQQFVDGLKASRVVQARIPVAAALQFCEE